jgi:hypothetical protein
VANNPFFGAMPGKALIHAEATVTPPEGWLEFQKFLDVLTCGADLPIYFRGIDDDKAEASRATVKHIAHDRTEWRSTFMTMKAWNAERYAVFMVINAGAGFKDAEIHTVRSIFVDSDEADPDKAAVIRAAVLAAKPTLLVNTSGNKFHGHWRVNDLPVGEFPAVQKALVMKFGTDRSVINPAQLMRVPGFLHQKSEPVPVTLEVLDHPPLTAEEVRAWLAPELAVQQQQVAVHQARIQHVIPLGNDEEARLASALVKLDPDASYDDWLKTLAALYHSGIPNGLAIGITWSMGGPKYKSGECEQMWPSFARAEGPKATLAGIYARAKEVGWTESDACRSVMARYAKVLVGQKAQVIDLSTGELRTFQSLHDMYAAFRVNPRTSYAKAWYSDREVPRFNRLVFKPYPPGAENSAAPDEYNTFQGFPVPPIRNPALSARFWQHVLEVLCNGKSEVYVYLRKYFAHLVQHPMELPDTALCFRSKQGAGKGFVFETVLAPLFGPAAVYVNSSEGLTGRFNGHLSSKLLITADEAVWGGNKASMGVLKSLITAKQLPVERKGLDLVAVDNFARVIVLSNEEWPIPRESDDRRWLILDSSNDRIGDGAYFAQLHADLAAGGLAAIMADLIEEDLVGWSPRIRPHTGCGFDIKCQSEIRLEWFFHYVQDGTAWTNAKPPATDGKPSCGPCEPVLLDGQLFVPSTGLAGAFNTFIGDRATFGGAGGVPRGLPRWLKTQFGLAGHHAQKLPLRPRGVLLPGTQAEMKTLFERATQETAGIWV